MALPERGSQPSLHACLPSCLPSFIPTHPPPYLPVQFSQLESLHAVEDLLSLGELGEVAPGELGATCLFTRLVESSLVPAWFLTAQFLQKTFFMKPFAGI